MFDRPTILDETFSRRVAAHDFPSSRTNPTAEMVAPHVLVDLFDTQIMSRHLDLWARRSKGKTFYSIGSSGHEGTAAMAAATRSTDMAFLHYRDAAFLIQRKKQAGGLTPLHDMALSFAASADDPISGGRHKVLGCAHTFVPPQTSTIASHLPKAVGAAHSLGMAQRLQLADAVLPHDSIILCSFGDASANHSTSQGAFNAACWAAYQHLPMPIVFLCEDNGIGISVRTPGGWIAANFAHRPALHYISCDGADMNDALRGCAQAVTYARTRRKPVFLHMQTIRLMGHAGADVELSYAPIAQIEAAEAQDPLLHSARILHEQAGMSGAEIVARYEDMRARVDSVARDALAKPRLLTAAEVMASIEPAKFEKPPQPMPDAAKRDALFAHDARNLAKPATLAKSINFALADIMLQYPNVAVFGEDVARKGGVYGVTQGLQEKFGAVRVFDTLLDEQTILGLAIGMAHNGFVPIPEIQFLAYLHNAEDQIRGEAATLSFFSNKQYRNPMVIRIAGLPYQKGFGGHFHNDNSLAVLTDIPGIIVACPSSAADAPAMLRECVRLAHEDGRVVVFIEPIALYHITDLQQPGDGAWTAPYMAPDQDNVILLGALGQFGKGNELAIITYGNGYFLSRQAADELKAGGIDLRIIDLRWLHPLNAEAIVAAVADCGKILIVDECRKSGSLSEKLMTLLTEAGRGDAVSRITAEDCFIPLGPAAELVLPSKESIIEAARAAVA
ncbi:MAG: MFS transporter [Sphingorhabdus sp.]|uniref:thiamine pyrophosphate-dependent enzyme n=1 Tax=Sphingorhabdus sp. TaxID=1902408 RepID=UPI0025E3DBD7|nr:thiamine pyrophosphate-dependent enzyme [Sphingorhabdus sp.]MCO4091914.1 MFS transporter [Sphingorhabdus sp.]